MLDHHCHPYIPSTTVDDTETESFIPLGSTAQAPSVSYTVYVDIVIVGESTYGMAIKLRGMML